ncbi:hypothetical protein [Bacteroides sp.]|uniref:hypothetical protein n=1 Tax=Bacteroides sp. TaxID=29523 RepID=UPI002623B5FB|nr:hypothetical protein [Bacteroides sp.]MDD3041292.1 hypothetical protein [Bacteroides sp.]
MPRKKEDLSGGVFGNLTAISPSNRHSKNTTYWDCRCACGNVVSVQAGHLKTGHTTSCGCLKGKIIGEKATPDMVGKTFGYLTVIEKVTSETYHSKWKCRCKCGNECIVRGSDLRAGTTISCGCYRNERVGDTLRKDISGQIFGKLTAIELCRVDTKRKYSPALWKCVCECGNEVVVDGRNLRKGTTHSCGCIKSLGEEKIDKILALSNIEYKKEVSFDGFYRIKGHPYRFDYAIYDNGKLSCLIEYQGEMHYTDDANGWLTEEKLCNIKEIDEIKREYCKLNNICLIEVPFTDYDKIDLKYIVGRIHHASKETTNE